MHHKLAMMNFNFNNSNVYTEKIKQIVSEIKKMRDFSRNFINTLCLVKQISSDQVQLLSQIRVLMLTDFIIEKIMSLIHLQQVVNSNKNARPPAVYTAADRKQKSDQQLQKQKKNENQCSECEKIDHLESAC